ncbi:MAG: UDP-N-acetylglucosamine 2-epimerase (non-hydrolyzing) [Thermoleophilia bacterium]|nr:UDP-N-acetylglucosamine 2-epimerase (non-hydrolyzing) [Thermoleophilia bacterium]
MAGKPVCFVVGARPNFMKAAPVYRALRALEPARPLLLVHTGQHYDEEMSEVFLAELGLPRPDVSLGIGSGTHGEQTARALVGVERVLLEHEPALTVVSGDVNSTLAAALASAKLRRPVAHIESGLRSFDESMPEEQNRRLTDHLSDVLLAHSPNAIENLAREGIESVRVHLVGNTMIDSVFGFLDAALTQEPWASFDVEPRAYGLVTLHRPALVDDPALLKATSEALAQLGQELALVFPVHPRTRARLEELGVVGELLSSGVRLTGPLGYLPFLGLEARAAFVLTDSGGVQEETSVLGVPCFTLRESTERPITIEKGTNTLLGARPERIAEIPVLLAAPRESRAIPLWDGRAGERAAGVLAAFLASGARGRDSYRPYGMTGADVAATVSQEPAPGAGGAAATLDPDT